MRRGPNLSGGGRYERPQAWIDDIVASDPALANVTLSCPPRYSSRLKSYGRAVLEGPGASAQTIIGRRSLASRRELLDTIIHEEVHHRLWQRAKTGNRRALELVAELELEETYVAEVAFRFLTLQDYLRSIGKK